MTRFLDGLLTDANSDNSLRPPKAIGGGWMIVLAIWGGVFFAVGGCAALVFGGCPCV